MWCSHEWGPGTAVCQRLAVKVFRGLRFLKPPSPPPTPTKKKEMCLGSSSALEAARPKPTLSLQSPQSESIPTSGPQDPKLCKPWALSAWALLKELKLSLTCQNYHTDNSNLKIAMTSIVTITNSCNTATNNLSLKKNSILYDLPEQEKHSWCRALRPSTYRWTGFSCRAQDSALSATHGCLSKLGSLSGYPEQ